MSSEYGNTTLYNNISYMLGIRVKHLSGNIANISHYCVGYHSECSNNPDIQHSKGTVFVLLYYMVHLHTKLCQCFEDRNDALS